MNVLDADYNQIDAQLLDPSSEVYSFVPDEILLWLGTEKLYEEFLDLDMFSRSMFADTYIEKIERYWELISNHSNARIMQMNFTEVDDKILVAYSCKIKTTFAFQIRKLNYLVQESAAKNRKIYIVDILSVQLRLGSKTFFNAPLYYNAKMSVAINVLPDISKVVVDIIMAMSGKIKKCVILDLDNTLWGGVIGDDGLAGIEIGQLGKGHVFSNLQRWLRQLRE